MSSPLLHNHNQTSDCVTADFTAWLSSKIAPNGDTNDNEGGCDPQEAQALEAYLRQETTPTEAAQAITRPISIATNPNAELHHLWALLYDAFLELPQPTITPLIALMRAIEDQPNPAAIPNESNHPDDRFWNASPGFANLWADMSPSYTWRRIADSSAGARRDALRTDHVRRAEVEARLVHANLAGLTIHWGYEVVADALERRDAMLDFEVPAAVEWLVVCGARFREGAGRGEQSAGLKKGEGKTEGGLWRGEDDSVMTVERWDFWKERLGDLLGDGGRAVDIMRE